MRTRVMFGLETGPLYERGITEDRVYAMLKFGRMCLKAWRLRRKLLRDEQSRPRWRKRWRELRRREWLNKRSHLPFRVWKLHGKAGLP